MDLFDIIGPVMIGPSSSHTAGAARIGRITRQLLGAAPVWADIGFYGSFAKTWKGHGTDLAVLGGLLGMAVDDERLRDSREIADAEGMRYTIHPIELRAAHPNTVVITARDACGRETTVRAASVGGGSILVQSLDGLKVDFTGESDTLIIRHPDAPGAIAEVSRVLSSAKMNIAAMRVFRREAGGDAAMAIELDGVPDTNVIDSIRALNCIRSVALLKKL